MRHLYVLVAALAGCATTNMVAPAAAPQVFVGSEQLAAGGSQITGFVMDEHGSALSGAVVRLRGSLSSEPIEASSNELGMYGFANVPPDVYTLVVNVDHGFANASVVVPGQTRVRVSFRGPYPSFIREHVYVEMIEPRSFDEAGPFLVERGG